MLLGAQPRIPASLPTLAILATDPEAIVTLTAAETVVEVDGVRYVGWRYERGAAE